MAGRRISYHLIAIILFTFCHASAQVTLVVDQVPAATPLDDSIYVSGTFNDWRLADPLFKLQRRLDGKLAVTIPSSPSGFEYKFHRGNWAKVETNERNEYRPNRTYHSREGNTIHIAILNWQDVGGARQFDNFIFCFFATALLALLVILYIGFIKSKKQQLAVAVQCFVAYLCLLLFGRVLFELASLKWQYYYTLAGDVLLFMSGPLWFFVVIASRQDGHKKKLLLHAIPSAAILVITILKVINVESLQLLAYRVWDSVSWNILIFFGGSVLANGLYFYAGWKTLAKLTAASAERTFMQHHVWLGAGFILLLLAKVLLIVTQSERMLFFADPDLMYCYATFFVLMVIYHTLYNHAIFRSPSTPARTEDLESLKTAVHQIMKETKCFKDPHLTLTDFAEKVHIKPHLLSRVINECYRQNFRDFVNKYRVEEFIEIARQDVSRRYTFLALANEVGFNSKSTFNAAFKKVTHRSPRDFFKSYKLAVQ